MSAPRLLFIPVSSAVGIGEYMRSRIVAEAALAEWPGADVRFLLSRNAPYASDCPFPTHLVEWSPTKHIAEVNRIVSEVAPDVVIFDASGRKAQLRHARRIGAKVVFVSQHARKRRRGFRLGRLAATDAHWIVQPDYVVGGLTWIERFKLRLLGKPAPLFLGPIFAPIDAAIQRDALARLGLERGRYLVFHSGSGGQRVRGGLAADRFGEAARRMAADGSTRVLVVYGANYPGSVPRIDGAVVTPALPPAEFVALLAGASAAVLGGGHTLLQAIAMGVPSVAVPVAKDQPRRIAACVRAGLALPAAADPDSIAREARRLSEPEIRQRLLARMSERSAGAGLAGAIGSLKELLEAGRRGEKVRSGVEE